MSKLFRLSNLTPVTKYLDDCRSLFYICIESREILQEFRKAYSKEPKNLNGLVYSYECENENDTDDSDGIDNKIRMSLWKVPVCSFYEIILVGMIRIKFNTFVYGDCVHCGM